MYNPETVRDNESHKIRIKTDHVISARRLDFIINKKKKSSGRPPSKSKKKRNER